MTKPAHADKPKPPTEPTQRLFNIRHITNMGQREASIKLNDEPVEGTDHHDAFCRYEAQRAQDGDPLPADTYRVIETGDVHRFAVTEQVEREITALDPA